MTAKKKEQMPTEIPVALTEKGKPIVAVDMASVAAEEKKTKPELALFPYFLLRRTVNIDGSPVPPGSGFKPVLVPLPEAAEHLLFMATDSERIIAKMLVDSLMAHFPGASTTISPRTIPDGCPVRFSLVFERILAGMHGTPMMVKISDLHVLCAVNKTIHDVIGPYLIALAAADPKKQKAPVPAPVPPPPPAVLPVFAAAAAAAPPSAYASPAKVTKADEIPVPAAPKKEKKQKAPPADPPPVVISSPKKEEKKKARTLKKAAADTEEEATEQKIDIVTVDPKSCYLCKEPTHGRTMVARGDKWFHVSCERNNPKSADFAASHVGDPPSAVPTATAAVAEISATLAGIEKALGGTTAVVPNGKRKREDAPEPAVAAVAAETKNVATATKTEDLPDKKREGPPPPTALVEAEDDEPMMPPSKAKRPRPVTADELFTLCELHLKDFSRYESSKEAHAIALIKGDGKEFRPRSLESLETAYASIRRWYRRKILEDLLSSTICGVADEVTAMLKLLRENRVDVYMGNVHKISATVPKTPKMAEEWNAKYAGMGILIRYVVLLNNPSTMEVLVRRLNATGTPQIVIDEILLSSLEWIDYFDKLKATGMAAYGLLSGAPSMLQTHYESIGDIDASDGFWRESHLRAVMFGLCEKLDTKFLRHLQALAADIDAKSASTRV